MCASANPDKVAEIAAILGDAVELLPRPSEVPDVVEDADTLEGNARLKAVAICEATGLPAVADDTGSRGVARSAAHPACTPPATPARAARYADNRHKLLRRTRRHATIVAPSSARWRWCVGRTARELAVDGVCAGTITRAEQGERGFGYDAVFVPDDGDGRSFAEMTEHEKNAVSHRGRAFRNLLALALEFVAGSPATEVDRPAVDHLVAADEPHDLVHRHRRVDVGRDHADAITDSTRAIRHERDVLVAAEQHLARSPGSSDGLPWSMPSAFSPTSATAQPRRHRDHRCRHVQRLLERQSERAVVAVHQRVAAGLDLGDTGRGVQVERAGAAGADDLAADVGVGLPQQRHRMVDGGLTLLARVDHHQMTLVAHHAAHLEPDRAGAVGQAAGVLGRDAAARQSDVDVDQASTDACARRRRRALASESIATVTRTSSAAIARKPIVVDGLVGEQQVVDRHRPTPCRAPRAAWRT